MSTPSHNLDGLRNAIVNPTGGVVGVVDDVLTLCRKHSLQLDWRADRCRVRSVGTDEEEVIDLPLRKSVFRAILARLATLCSEQGPDSFSPYADHGELSVGSDSKSIFHVAWVNTPEEQKLELMPLGASSDQSVSLDRPQIEAHPFGDGASPQQPETTHLND